MKDRIRLIMEKENLTPAKFADRLEINRAVISHILNGRNNPSLDVVTKILELMDFIKPKRTGLISSRARKLRPKDRETCAEPGFGL